MWYGNLYDTAINPTWLVRIPDTNSFVCDMTHTNVITYITHVWHICDITHMCVSYHIYHTRR